MIDQKNLLQSKTVWGIIITVLAILLPRFGIQPLGEGQAEVIAELVTQLIGLCITLYGRLKAVTDLKLIK